jgi:hypothetical protein
MDIIAHGEEGYARGEGAVLVLPAEVSAPKGPAARDGIPVPAASHSHI